jgi:DNA modification methylase
MIDLRLGDAFKLIKEIPDNSIDLILTDPPYDGPNYMPSLTDNQKEEMAKEFYRVLKDSGNLALFCGFEDKWKWYNILTKIGFKFQRELIWCYTNPFKFGFKPKKFIPAHETILWFSKTNNYYFNKEGRLEKSYILHYAYIGIIRHRGLENLPKEKHDITPKPLKIAEILVNRLSKEGDLVLDPFAGYGTFAIASLKLKRNFIGFEIREEIFKIAKERIEKFRVKSLKDYFI